MCILYVYTRKSRRATPVSPNTSPQRMHIYIHTHTHSCIHAYKHYALFRLAQAPKNVFSNPSNLPSTEANQASQSSQPRYLSPLKISSLWEAYGCLPRPPGTPGPFWGSLEPLWGSPAALQVALRPNAPIHSFFFP